MKTAEELVRELLSEQPAPIPTSSWPREPLRSNLTVHEKHLYGVPLSVEEVEEVAEGMADELEKERFDEGFQEGLATGREQAYQEILERLNARR